MFVLLFGAVALLPTTSATAADEGTRGPSSEYPSSLLPQSGTQPQQGTGSTGGAADSPAIRDRAKRRSVRKKTLDKPVLASFDLSRTTLFVYGRPATIRYRIDDLSRYVRVRLAVVRAGVGAIARFNLGRRRTGRVHSFRWRGTRGNQITPDGSYHFRITARDPDGNRLVRSSQSIGGTPLQLQDHRFPVQGPYSLGGKDARFGAPRRGHDHKGQDISAALGTPVVAPRAGTITWRAYQGDGAGHYLVLAGANEPYNYVFMHLRSGSLLVRQGDQVQTGQQLAEVGSTGVSSGPHLHFEIWDGPWFNGGKAIDPLPMLLRWAAGP
jgi:murein DD-endopeptidase MepM/ murein hydrolase activator NlpD